jgi:hypothetical protein
MLRCCTAAPGWGREPGSGAAGSGARIVVAKTGRGKKGSARPHGDDRHLGKAGLPGARRSRLRRLGFGVESGRKSWSSPSQAGAGAWSSCEADAGGRAGWRTKD